MKSNLLVVAAFICTSVFAQTEKGAIPLSPSQALTGSPSVTRAVVIGISDYQDKDIPDLRFADRDAEAFADFRYRLLLITFTNLRHLYQTCFANENIFILPCPDL